MIINESTIHEVGYGGLTTKALVNFVIQNRIGQIIPIEITTRSMSKEGAEEVAKAVAKKGIVNNIKIGLKNAIENPLHSIGLTMNHSHL